MECGADPSDQCPAQSQGLVAELEEERGNPASRFVNTLSALCHARLEGPGSADYPPP